MAKQAKPAAPRSSVVEKAARRFRAASFLAKISMVTAVVIGLTGSIAGVATAYPLVEPYFYVSRGALRLVMDKQAVATDRQTLFQLNEYLARAQQDPAAATSPIVRERIEELKRQIEQTTERLRKAGG